MEAGTAASHSTGSKTIADLMVCAAEQFADRVAVRHKVGDDWHDVTFAQVGDIVREIGLGLIDVGIVPGERVSLLCNTRPEWTYCDFAITSAGAVVVPIYPTNSPEECEWVAGNSESVAVVCEDASQVAKIAA
ncbi:MAG TPA: AMP-binding protein, partial [Solirubrobacteraceae bacterium]